MDRTIDPKHIKTLADILALVLVDQPGESMAALEAVRRRAKQDGVTGGALKELVQTLSATASASSRSTQWTPPPRASTTAQIEQLRNSLMESQRRYVETRLELDRERRDADVLRRRVDELYAPVKRSRQTIAEAAWLRGRVAVLERQLAEANQRSLDLENIASVPEATVTLQSAGARHIIWRNGAIAIAIPCPRPLTVIRATQAVAGLLLLLGLVADQTAFTPRPPAHHPIVPPVVISL